MPKRGLTPASAGTYQFEKKVPLIVNETYGGFREYKCRPDVGTAAPGEISFIPPTTDEFFVPAEVKLHLEFTITPGAGNALAANALPAIGGGSNIFRFKGGNHLMFEDVQILPNLQTDISLPQTSYALARHMEKILNRDEVSDLVQHRSRLFTEKFNPEVQCQTIAEFALGGRHDDRRETVQQAIVADIEDVCFPEARNGNRHFTDFQPIPHPFFRAESHIPAGQKMRYKFVLDRFKRWGIVRAVTANGDAAERANPVININYDHSYMLFKYRTLEHEEIIKEMLEVIRANHFTLEIPDVLLINRSQAFPSEVYVQKRVELFQGVKKPQLFLVGFMTTVQLDGAGVGTLKQFGFTPHGITSVDLLWDGKKDWEKPLNFNNQDLYLNQNEYLTKVKDKKVDFGFDIGRLTNGMTIFCVDLSIAKDGKSGSFKPLLDGQCELLINSQQVAGEQLVAVCMYETPLYFECTNINQNQWVRATPPLVEADITPVP